MTDSVEGSVKGSVKVKRDKKSGSPWSIDWYLSLSVHFKAVSVE
jgi:hypothetical protein